MAPLTIPPDSWRAWVRLAVWEFWMGMLVCGAVLFGVGQISSAPDYIVMVDGFNNCTAERLGQPCQHFVYRMGGLNALFSIMTGVLGLTVAAWLLWIWKPLGVEAPGKYGALAGVPLVALALWLSLRESHPRRPST